MNLGPPSNLGHPARVLQDTKVHHILVQRPGLEQFLYVRADPADLEALTSSRSVGGEDVLASVLSEKKTKVVITAFSGERRRTVI